MRAEVDEETGEFLYNPYTIVSGSISLAEEETVPEAETVPQKIAVIEESEPVEETAAAEIWQESVFEEETPAEEITAEQAEPAEIPVITETSVVICESDINAAFGLFDMSQSRKLDYTVVKSQDSYNVMIPDDYDQLFFNGIDEEGNAFFNAAGEEVQVNFNEVEMNIQIVNFAELKIKDIAKPDEYSIDRFCGEETLPYYYGEIMKVTPADGYNIVIGDMKYSDAVSVAVNDDAVVPEERYVSVEVPTGFEAVGNAVEGKFKYGTTVTVQPAKDQLKGMKYTLSVSHTDGEIEESICKPLTISWNEVLIENDIVKIQVSNQKSAFYLGFDETRAKDLIDAGFTTNEKDKYSMNRDDAFFRTGFYKFGVNIPDKVKINKYILKGKDTGSVLAAFDENGTMLEGGMLAKENAVAEVLYDNRKTNYRTDFKLNLIGVHDDICLDIEYDAVETIEFSFNTFDDSNAPKDGIVTAYLNDSDFEEKSLNKENNADNTIKFSPIASWEIIEVQLNETIIKNENKDSKNQKILFITLVKQKKLIIMERIY